jgi:hypothetical protein
MDRRAWLADVDRRWRAGHAAAAYGFFGAAVFFVGLGLSELT